MTLFMLNRHESELPRQHELEQEQGPQSIGFWEILIVSVFRLNWVGDDIIRLNSSNSR